MFPLSQNDCTQYKEHRMDEVNQHSSSADTMEIGYKYQDHDEEPVLLFHKQQKTIKENRYIKSFIICILSITCFHSFIIYTIGSSSRYV